MMKKGEWEAYDGYICVSTWLITGIVLFLFRVGFEFFKSRAIGGEFGDYSDMSVPGVIIIALFLGFGVGFILAAILSVILDSIDFNWKMNVKRRAVRTKEVVQKLPVVSKISGYYTEGFISVDSYTKYEVKVKLGEGVYHTFHGIENYAAVKEGGLAAVKVRLYFDNEGDVFYVKVLELIGGLENNENTAAELSLE